jgi:hypothetical protein
MTPRSSSPRAGLGEEAVELAHRGAVALFLPGLGLVATG